MSLPVVAIAGATGRLGKPTTEAFLSSKWRPNFKEIILLSRSPPQPEHEQYIKAGATLRTYSEAEGGLKEALNGVNILVNVVSGLAGDFKDLLVKAAAQTPSITLYFPSEFGVDHGNGTDPDYDIEAWRHKQHHIDLAKKLFPSHVKVCSVYVSLFTELTIGAFYGLDVKNGRFESVGSADQPITFTSLIDAGKALAALSSLPIDQIPERLRLSGDSVSLNAFAAELTAAGGGEVEVTEIDFEEYRKVATAMTDKKPYQYLRFLMGGGNLDFSTRNHNELVNPGGKHWRWKTVKDHAREVEGYSRLRQG
ncbi:hypothetical protein CLAIMM_01458 [Cladophialophora immunda]|nr:hypothetical protein CLAIMM_01458 [Cladophialophora immunda]